ncbi:hypothetical protein, partial [Escherichia coli]|uniref:hypothetical protein n=1 Tax=Escherichia coli TaxID=562 RepID=UPI001BC84AE5
WLMMSLWDALRMNMMISYQELVRTFLSILFLIKILPNMLAIVSCIGPPYFLLKRSNIHYSVRISTQASAFFVIVYRRAMNFNQ